MGGDHAPRIVVEGAHLARQTLPDVRFVIFGDEAQLRPLVAKYAGLAAVVDIRHTPDKIASDEKPATALRQGKNSSMRLAIDAVAGGEADCVVSAGNTGALMAIAKLVLRVLPGVDRPAIATAMPTRVAGRGVVMLDLGANAECDKNNLLQFSILGSIYSRVVYKNAQPKIGLLNIGSESIKGPDLVRETADLLSATPLPGQFIGFTEGDDILSGEVDVVVTDGFTGNVTLKTIEGTAKLIKNMIKEGFKGSWLMKLGAILCIPGILVALPAIKKVSKRIDPRSYNGASFLGLKGLCIKSHGGTDAIGFANAIHVAADLAANQFNLEVEKELERVRAEIPVAATEGAA